MNHIIGHESYNIVQSFGNYDMEVLFILKTYHIILRDAYRA